MRTRKTIMTSLILFTVVLLSSFKISAANHILIERIDNSHGLSSDLISEIIQDDNGFIWIASSDGLNCYTGTEFIVYRHRKNDPTSLSSSQLKNICAAPDGTIWVGTVSDGINILDPVSKKITRFNAINGYFDLPDQHISNLYTDSKGCIWIVTPQKIMVYNTRDKTHSILKTNKRRLATSTLETSDGNILMGSWESEILKYNKETQSLEALAVINGDFNGQPIRSIFEDKQGHLWVGCWEGGIYKTLLKEDSIEILQQQDVINSNFSKENMFNIVYDIDQDKNGTIWLGTDVGLGLISNPYADEIDIEWLPTGNNNRSFIAKDAVNLFVDNAKTIWIGSQGKGISKVDFNRSNFSTYTSTTSPGEFSSDIFRSFWYYNNEFYVGINALGFGKYSLKDQSITPYEKLSEFRGLYERFPNLNAITAFIELDERYLLFATRYKGIIAYDKQTHQANRVSLPLFGI